MEHVGKIIKIPEKTAGKLEPKFSEILLQQIRLDKTDYTRGMAILQAKFKGLKLEAEEVVLNYQLLSDLTYEQLQRGILIMCRTHKEIYPNTNLIAYLREYALKDHSLPTAGEAWEMVRTEMSRCGGRYGEPKIKEPLVQKAMEGVGWRQICDGNPDVVRSNFYRVYESLVESQKQDQLGGLGELKCPR